MTYPIKWEADNLRPGDVTKYRVLVRCAPEGPIREYFTKGPELSIDLPIWSLQECAGEHVWYQVTSIYGECEYGAPSELSDPFVAMPLPEPSGLWVLVAGVLVLVGMAKRSKAKRRLANRWTPKEVARMLEKDPNLRLTIAWPQRDEE